MSEATSLPKFGDPPVVETVLGVEFARLEKWGMPHFGMFWNAIGKKQFPTYAVKPPLDSQIEHFEKAKQVTGPQVQILSEPELRCWFVDPDDRTLLQVQNNRFTFNWRKRGSGDSYPHYDDSIRPSFCRYWKLFAEFVEKEKLGQLNVVQCEVTYINHCEVGKGWNSAADIGSVFPCWSGATNQEFLPVAENVSFDVTYRMPGQTGRLRVSMKPAIRTSDGVDILQLTLTARGRPTGNDSDAVLSWLDTGRQWVVRGFADITSPQMHSIWKKDV